MEDPHFAQASALIDSVVDRVLQVVAQTTGWEALDSQEGVSGGKIPAGESSLQVRVQTVINKTPEQIHEIKEIRLVKQLGDHMRILYEHHGAPWPVSDRDLVLASRYVERPDGILIINKSIDIGLPEVDGLVRADMVFGSMYLRRSGDSATELTLIGCMDPKGSIPNLIINNGAQKQITKVIALRNALGG